MTAPAASEPDQPLDVPATALPTAPELPRPLGPVLPRYKLTVAYDGTLFHGWQRQTDTQGQPLRTVQGELELALMRLLRQPVAVRGASRTDSGVHALGQSVQMDVISPVPLARLAQAVNSRLPDDLEVMSVELAPPGWDVLRDVESKQYRYRLYASVHKPLAQRNYVFHCWTPLDLAPMRDAAARLVGTHDFGGLAAAGHGRASTVRTIHDCRVETAGLEVHIVVAGDGFLYNMVRILAGTLVEVGRGRFAPSVIDDILRTADRRLAGPTLPPNGLWLEWIRYRSIS